MKTLEAQEQRNLITYCRYKGIPVFHIPNGGSRNKAEAAHLKEQGVSAGVPDLCFPAARHGYHGLYIEMKAGKNKATAAQKEWLELLNKNGYLAVVCVGFDEAREIIDKYFTDERG